MTKAGPNRRYTIARIPDDTLTEDVFALGATDIPTPGEGEVLVRNRVLSIDAANRSWLQGATYRSAIGAGAVMPGLAVAEVVESRSSDFFAGDIVFGDVGWQDYAALPAAALEKQKRIEPMSHLLSLYGTSALTAFFGLTEVGELARGETMVVSAAAGSVGIMAGQIAQALGARTVGIAGGAEKCDWLIGRFGFDAAIDYKAANFKGRLLETCPDGIDVFFDNVGASILESCLFSMAPHGRVVCCGAVGSYDGEKPTYGPRGVPGLIITRELTMRGFIVQSFAQRYDEAREALAEWARQGIISPCEDRFDGLESAPGALIDMLAGGNRGKRMVMVS